MVPRRNVVIEYSFGIIPTCWYLLFAVQPVWMTVVQPYPVHDRFVQKISQPSKKSSAVESPLNMWLGFSASCQVEPSESPNLD